MLGLIISAIFVGLIIGALGRLVLPGRQDISIVLTIVIGVIAALIGSFIASAIGVGETRGIDGSSSSSRWPWPRAAWPWSPAGRHRAVDASEARPRSGRRHQVEFRLSERGNARRARPMRS